MMELIAEVHLTHPILGICLGYQALGAFFGAEVIHSPLPMHGKTSAITHHKKGLFKGIPDPTLVMRYHSLNIANIPDSISITAHTVDTLEPMALEHCSLPISGVQFHPESVLTADGLAMVANWLQSLH
jgi:anthranilate synthase/aminodeoxychorismate synthase-like glutamine amidotransferase